MSPLQVSRIFALILGMLTPALEVVRRWGTWWQYPPAFLDDILIGGFLLAGVWATRTPFGEQGRPVLASGWAFATGMIYCSASVHYQALMRGEPDPAPIPSSWVLAIKLFGLATATAALVCALVPTRPSSQFQRVSGK